MANKTVSVREVFDSNPVTSSYQMLVCFLCFLIMFLDGFDLMVTGVAIPKIAEFLHSKPSALGLAVSAGLIGTFIGSMGLGTLADRFGRKWMLVVSALVFGFFTLLVVSITAVWQLAFFRFIAGVGLGGVLPNALAFGSEYAPSRLRTTFVATVYAGLPVGATLSGLMSAWFIPRFGWQSLFVLGGVSPVIVALLAAAFLPESLEFLVGKGKDKVRIRNIVTKIAPALSRDEQVEFYPTEKKLPGVSVKNLFTERRAPMTILFWITLIAAHWFGAVLIVWAPTMLHKGGATVVQYSLAFAGLNFGSVVSTILVGRLMDWRSPFKILPIGFVLAFASLLAFGWFASGSFLAATVLSVTCGFFMLGSQSGTIALVTVSYPTDIRGTAIGWTYAVTRFGNVLSTAAGGYLLTAGWSITKICSANALIGLFCAALILILRGRVAAVERHKSMQIPVSLSVSP